MLMVFRRSKKWLGFRRYLSIISGSMNDFKTWFEEIKADTLWYDSFHFMYHKKNIPKCAQECFVWLLADPVKRHEDIVSHRKTLATWCQGAKWDTSASVQLQQEEVKAEPVEVKPEDMPLRRGSPEYIK